MIDLDKKVENNEIRIEEMKMELEYKVTEDEVTNLIENCVKEDQIEDFVTEDKIENFVTEDKITDLES